MDTALAGLHEGVALVDAESTAILFATETFAAMAGRERVFLLGKPLGQVLRLGSSAGGPVPAADLPWSGARRGAAEEAPVYRVETPRGPRSMEVSVSDFEWLAEDGRALRHLIVTQRDVTERRRAEEAAFLARTTAEAANKELEAFSSSVAHDLRAPLRAMDGFSRLLLDQHGPRLDADGRELLARVRAASSRMGKMIDDLLRLARVTRGDLRRDPVDLGSLAGEVGAALSSAEPGRKVAFHVAPGLAAEGDAPLLRLALENLLSNAWKFTGGRAQAHVEFGASRLDGKTVFFVRDDGAGFDMAFAEKLFTAFGRLHTVKEFEGTGVGLATVQRIIQRHGGRIWGEGRVGRGATFYFTLWEDRR